jgi:gamma-glutamylcyclotransferase (GGCT)/AIG2-like uncharacterized protein YtfP
MTSPTHLFVYGTLLRGVPSAKAAYLEKRGRYRGEAALPGYLLDLGSYPGLVYEPSAAAQVYGQVFALDDPAGTLAELDRYEGIEPQAPEAGEYRRAALPMLLEGAAVECWVYLYNRPPAGLPRIPGGDYLAYYPQQARHLGFIERGRGERERF